MQIRRQGVDWWSGGMAFGTSWQCNRFARDQLNSGQCKSIGKLDQAVFHLKRPDLSNAVWHLNNVESGARVVCYNSLTLTCRVLAIPAVPWPVSSTSSSASLLRTGPTRLDWTESFSVLSTTLVLPLGRPVKC